MSGFERKADIPASVAQCQFLATFGHSAPQSSASVTNHCAQTGRSSFGYGRATAGSALFRKPCQDLHSNWYKERGQVSPEQFNHAMAVAVAHDGTVFAVDYGNNRIQKWTSKR